LSRDNNNPELVKDLFTTFSAGTEVVVASRYAETPVYRITSSGPIGPSGAAKESLPVIQVEVKADVKMDVRLHPKWKPTPLGF
jgi:hypothetical protein